MTAVGGDFLLQPVDPGAAGVMELSDGGEEALQRDGGGVMEDGCYADRKLNLLLLLPDTLPSQELP